MRAPKLRHEQRTEVPELAAAAKVGTKDAATSSRRRAQSKNESTVAAPSAAPSTTKYCRRLHFELFPKR